MCAHRGGLRRTCRSANGRGQDDRGRVRGLPRARERPQMLLHHTDQGALESEVRRPGTAPRRRQRWAAYRRHVGQFGGPDRGDDHRGTAEHDLREVIDAGKPRIRGTGRSALSG